MPLPSAGLASLSWVRALCVLWRRIATRDALRPGLAATDWQEVPAALEKRCRESSGCFREWVQLLSHLLNGKLTHADRLYLTNVRHQWLTASYLDTGELSQGISSISCKCCLSSVALRCQWKERNESGNKKSRAKCGTQEKTTDCPCLS